MRGRWQTWNTLCRRKAWGISTILDRLGTGTLTEQALREVLHDNYGDLAQANGGVLKKS